MPERLSDAELDVLESWYRPASEVSARSEAIMHLIAEVREWRVAFPDVGTIGHVLTMEDIKRVLGTPEKLPGSQVQPWVDVVTEINKVAIEQRQASIYPEDWAKGPGHAS